MVSVEFTTSRRRRIALVLVLLVLLAAGTAAGVAITVLDFNPLEPAQGMVDDSALVVEDESITYEGLAATTLDFTINNTDSVDHTATVSVRLLGPGGSATFTANTGPVTVSADGTASQSIGLGDTDITDFETVEVLVEETS